MNTAIDPTAPPTSDELQFLRKLRPILPSLALLMYAAGVLESPAPSAEYFPLDDPRAAKFGATKTLANLARTGAIPGAVKGAHGWLVTSAGLEEFARQKAGKPRRAPVKAAPPDVDAADRAILERVARVTR